jgi:hypothetical protein
MSPRLASTRTPRKQRAGLLAVRAILSECQESCRDAVFRAGKRTHAHQLEKGAPGGLGVIGVVIRSSLVKPIDSDGQPQQFESIDSDNGRFPSLRLIPSDLPVRFGSRLGRGRLCVPRAASCLRFENPILVSVNGQDRQGGTRCLNPKKGWPGSAGSRQLRARCRRSHVGRERLRRIDH